MFHLPTAFLGHGHKSHHKWIGSFNYNQDIFFTWKSQIKCLIFN